MFSVLRNERGSWTLIGLLVSIAIIAVLFAVVIFPRISPEGRTKEQAAKEGLIKPKEGQTVLGASIDKGKETACMSNLRGIRQMIDYTKASEESLPASLRDMKLGSAGLCPVTSQPYQYDPATGQARCTTPGHEGL